MMPLRRPYGLFVPRTPTPAMRIYNISALLSDVRQRLFFGTAFRAGQRVRRRWMDGWMVLISNSRHLQAIFFFFRFFLLNPGMRWVGRFLFQNVTIWVVICYLGGRMTLFACLFVWGAAVGRGASVTIDCFMPPG